MRSPCRHRGVGLVEVMLALTLVTIGAVGIMSLHSAGARMQADARRMTRATAIAQDLLNQIELWRYDDARLANAVTTNDGDIGDAARAFETSASPPFDGDEAALTVGGAQWLGIPATALQEGNYQRFWNVSYRDPAAPASLLDMNGNGVADAVRVAVIVRWPYQDGWRRVVLLGMVRNPAEGQ